MKITVRTNPEIIIEVDPFPHPKLFIFADKPREEKAEQWRIPLRLLLTKFPLKHE